MSSSAVELPSTNNADAKEDKVVTTPSEIVEIAADVTPTSNEDTVIEIDTDTEIIPESDLEALLTDTNKKRDIWIVTTAGLPWKTGTAMNPLLRALELCKLTHSINSVTLVIPWLPDVSSRTYLYGSDVTFTTSTDQKEYIYEYCVDHCNVTKEQLCNATATSDFVTFDIEFYNGIYNAIFGSIFPSVDICTTLLQFIAKHNSNSADQLSADVCILEEPEHLNWIPHKNSPTKASSKTDSKNDVETDTTSVATNDQEETEEISTATGATISWRTHFNHVVGILHTNYSEYMRQYSIVGCGRVTATAIDALSSLCVKAYCHRVIRLSPTLPTLDVTKEVTKNVHGVRYEFFQQQQDFVDESAIKADAEHGNETNAVSETTRETSVVASNADNEAEGIAPTTLNVTTSNIDDAGENSRNDDDNDTTTSPLLSAGGGAKIYFIGKLIWAKGFENVLEVQEIYKERTATTAITSDAATTSTGNTTGHYFPIDVYGSGKDTIDIQKAFFGRKLLKQQQNGKSSSLFAACAGGNSGTTVDDDEDDEAVGKIFDATEPSLRSQLTSPDDGTVNTYQDESSVATADDIGMTTPTKQKTNDTVAATILATPTVDLLPSPTEIDHDIGNKGTSDGNNDKTSSSSHPLNILGDLSGKTVSTTVDTADAAFTLIESVMVNGFGFGRKKKKNDDDDDDDDVTKTTKSSSMKRSSSLPKFSKIASAKTRFKWRRTPIPARFLGVVDHVELREHEHHAVFLNMSTSEVLCTTSAEALAMGKYVILPHHPSNEFFYQFQNCLVYKTLPECVDHILHAQSTQPQELLPSEQYTLSWAGATRRLIEACKVTRTELQQRIMNGDCDADNKAVTLHKKASNIINII